MGGYIHKLYIFLLDKCKLYIIGRVINNTKNNNYNINMPNELYSYIFISP